MYGTPKLETAVHPIGGKEIRALRRPQRVSLGSTGIADVCRERGQPNVQCVTSKRWDVGPHKVRDLHGPLDRLLRTRPYQSRKAGAKVHAQKTMNIR
jgi:hypothetical protein